MQRGIYNSAKNNHNKLNFYLWSDSVEVFDILANRPLSCSLSWFAKRSIKDQEQRDQASLVLSEDKNKATHLQLKLIN